MKFKWTHSHLTIHADSAQLDGNCVKVPSDTMQEIRDASPVYVEDSAIVTVIVDGKPRNARTWCTVAGGDAIFFLD